MSAATEATQPSGSDDDAVAKALAAELALDDAEFGEYGTVGETLEVLRTAGDVLVKTRDALGPQYYVTPTRIVDRQLELSVELSG